MIQDDRATVYRRKGLCSVCSLPHDGILELRMGEEWPYCLVCWERLARDREATNVSAFRRRFSFLLGGVG